MYYWLWVWALPKLMGYKIRQEIVDFGDGAQSHRLTKVPVAELEAWDRTHDAAGYPLGQAPILTEEYQGSESKGASEVVLSTEKSAA